jgi:hypothetical protein
MTSSRLTDHVLFFANGIAVRSGFTPSTHDCYAALDVADLRDLPFNFGRWRDDPASGGVRVDWKEGPGWNLKREGALLSLGGKKLLKLRPVDGLVLDGTFVSNPAGGPAATLTFRPDGTFTASGLTEGMTCRPPTGPPPASGSGRYAARKWTLILELAGGGVVLFPITVPDGEDLKRVARFSLGAYDFERTR